MARPREGWRTRGDRGHLVRYEDLVLDPEGTFRRLLDYLELDSSPETLGSVLEHGSEEILRLPGSGQEASEVRAHRTVSDPRASIGRWREGGDDHFAELSQEVFGAALLTFGYV